MGVITQRAFEENSASAPKGFNIVTVQKSQFARKLGAFVAMLGFHVDSHARAAINSCLPSLLAAMAAIPSI